jgi:hypothetical protein
MLRLLRGSSKLLLPSNRFYSATDVKATSFGREVVEVSKATHVVYDEATKTGSDRLIVG